MYTLYTDKGEDFKCNIDVEGAKLSDTQARLVLKNKDLNLLFEGKISSDGSCLIPIKKLKDVLEEGTKGDMKLEVIAEGTYFSPWEDEFEVKTNKKVTVEVANDPTKTPIKENKIGVKVRVPSKTYSSMKEKPQTSHGKVISELLQKKGININNLDKKSNEVNVLIEKYISKFNINEDPKHLIEQIIENLTKNK